MPHRSSRSPGRTPLPQGVGQVREELVEGPVAVARHPAWSERFPWLAQGTTTRGRPGSPFDLALFGGGGSASTLERWTTLVRAERMERAVHGRQVHGGVVRFHREGPPGLELALEGDGHVTRSPGVLVAVTVADCVPVFVVTAEPRAVAVLHAGWRGAAAGILEAGLEVFAHRLGIGPAEVHVHLGPAICGSCYEVGPEVHEALGLIRPDGPTPVDLRAVLTRRAASAGVEGRRMSVSTWCTRCGDPPFFSHRGGDPERQAGFAGIRD